MMQVIENRGQTTVLHPELDEVAKFWKQGNWQLRLAIGPDEWLHEEWGTRATCESRAMRHAAAL